MWASEGGHVDVVKELLRARAGVDLKDEVYCLTVFAVINDTIEG